MGHLDNLKYLFENTYPFMAKVFEGDPRWIEAMTGSIAAHGDKTEQYRDYWESLGLEYRKARIIYFLTYSKLMDRPKHLSREWVVDNYSTYAKFLPA